MNTLQIEQPSAGRQSMYSVDQAVEGQLFQSQALRRKNLVFAITLTFIQVFFCWVYGFLVYSPAILINVTSIITAIALAILIIGGFGLVFGYTKRLTWSGIGFNLFITAFCLEYYPLINDFWTKTAIEGQNNPTLDFTYGNRYYNLFLANRDTSPIGNSTYYGDCLTNAMKCALAMVVAFSSVLGRAGQLECLVILIIGVIGYELNRQIVQQRIGSDAFGTFTIFTFGGFMGLALGILAYLREKKAEYVIHETSLRKYNGEEQSVLFSIFGALIIFALFPFLAFEIDAYIFQNLFSDFTSPLLILLGMGAGCIGAICCSILVNGHLIVRDATHGVIAGAIAIGAASLYLIVPTYALITGFISGFIQAIIQNYAERYGIAKGFIISTVSWSLFGLQGVIGGCWASGWNKLTNNIYGANFNTSVTKSFGEQYQFYNMLVSAGMGAAFGLGAGLINYFINFQANNQYFDDGYYWRNSDCIRPLKRAEKAPEPEIRSQSVVLVFEEGAEEDVYNRHAFL